MAQFSYEASYQGRRTDKNLSGQIVQGINQAREKQLLIAEDFDRPDYKATFRTFVGDDVVIFGLRSYPGKAEGTESVHIVFSGLEKDILEVKGRLHKTVSGIGFK